MGIRLGIAGPVNSGKSFGRRTIPDGENVMVLAPSMKATHLRTSSGKPSGYFKMSKKRADGTIANEKELYAAAGVANRLELLHKINNEKQPGTWDFIYEGSIALIHSLAELPIWMKFINLHMPKIHTVIQPDFTHYISNYISGKQFINRKAGGEAYQRFWELAGESLENFILLTDHLREELVVITEYHAEFTVEKGEFELYVPAGKMMTEKFKPESYYDIFLYTDVLYAENGDAVSYDFITRKNKKYPDARAMELFEPRISNDWQPILNKVRDYYGVPLV